MIYYGAKGLKLNPDTFKKNLSLYTEDGKYNILAQLLSDDSHIPVRVAIFSGKSKADQLYSVKYPNEGKGITDFQEVTVGKSGFARRQIVM